MANFKLECDAEPEDVFFETQKTQNVEVQIKVDPPPVTTAPSLRHFRENSPVFYLEPDDWPEDTTPPMVTSPTRALSPCGCGKSHTSHAHMESLPEDRRAFSTSSFKRDISTSPPVPRSCSGTYLTLPSPRAAIMSEIIQQQQYHPPHQRQRKIAIPVLCARAVNSAVRTIFSPIWRDLKKDYSSVQKLPNTSQNFIYISLKFIHFLKRKLSFSKVYGFETSTNVLFLNR